MKLFRYILIVIVLVLTGCSSGTDEPGAPAGSRKCTLRITLRTEASPEKGSRAGTWGDDYDKELPLPSETNISYINFYLVSNDNPDDAIRLTHSLREGAGVYTAEVSLDAGMLQQQPDGSTTLTGRIVAVVNCPYDAAYGPFYLYPSDIDDILKGGVLPMWGVMTVTDLQLIPDKVVDAKDELVLLRALPKITVELDKTISDRYTIVSVVPDQAAGYPSVTRILPTGAESATRTKELMIEGCFNADVATPDFRPVFLRESASKMLCYLPELKCLQPDGAPMSYTVTLRRTGGNQTFTGTIYLRDYDKDGMHTGEPFGTLVRNHDYQFIIRLSPLELLVSVQKWRFGAKVHIDLE